MFPQTYIFTDGEDEELKKKMGEYSLDMTAVTPVRADIPGCSKLESVESGQIIRMNILL